MCEVNKLCGHAHSPLGVGACFPYSLSQSGAPSLPPNYQRSSLLWAPPTPQLLRPLPRSLHLSEGARCSAPMLGSPWLPHNRYVRLDTVLDPGWSNTPCPFYSAPCLLLPAGVSKPSATSNAAISGLHPSRSALSVTIAPRLLSCLRIKQPIAGLPARLDTWPGASSYQGGIHTRSIVRHCQAATGT